MSEIKIHIFHIGKVCVAPELPLYFTNQVVVESSAAIDEQLAARGVAPVDWDAVLLSHLDCDHANGLKLVADAKKILVLKDELRFAENGSPVNRIRYNADWWRGTKMQTFDWNGLMGSAGRSYDVFGDGMLVMVNIPGHSKGLCALRITGGGREVAPTAATRKNRGSRCCSPASPTTTRRRKSRSRESGHRVGSGTALRASPTTISMSNRARLHYKRVNRQRQRRCLLLFSGLNNFYRGCSKFVKNFHSGITRFA